jgi:hypothetical protein
VTAIVPSDRVVIGSWLTTRDYVPRVHRRTCIGGPASAGELVNGPLIWPMSPMACTHGCASIEF